MQAIIERCCGLDVHQDTVVACLLIGAAGARARKEVRTFRTVRRELEALRNWLTAYLRDKFHRLKARRGALRAALAIAHKIVVAAYHMLARGVVYRDLGEAYLDQIGERRIVANLKRRLERLGYQVTLEPKAEAA